MVSTDTYLWEDLLSAIEDGRVVPIVGRDLLVIETDAGPRLFHNLVAERLAAELNIPVDHLAPGYDVNDVVYAYEDFQRDPTPINSRIRRIVTSLSVPVPQPLRLLAEVLSFRLFISTTVDTLLRRAITEVRGREPACVTFPPSSLKTVDFDEDLLEAQGSMVFQILGQVSPSATFTVTEGQMLEQMHDFMASDRRPVKLINRLQESHLLILGVSFPDWLSRFLLRVCRAKPLWDSRPMMEIIADNQCTHNEFSLFLHRFSPQQSHLFTGGSPVDFVQELHKRWFELHPSDQPSTNVVQMNVEEPADMEPGSIFISYASEDRAAAFQLADRLTAAGLEVWVDRRINPGDDFNHKIERHISKCCAFVPVISRHTQTSEERYFRGEWQQACERDRKYRFALDTPFIFPVVVDATPYSELERLQHEIFGRSAVQAAGGQAPQSLIQQLDLTQKTWRKRDKAV
jgi:hypothetical protein